MRSVRAERDEGSTGQEARPTTGVVPFERGTTDGFLYAAGIRRGSSDSGSPRGHEMLISCGLDAVPALVLVIIISLSLCFSREGEVSNKPHRVPTMRTEGRRPKADAPRRCWIKDRHSSIHSDSRSFGLVAVEDLKCKNCAHRRYIRQEDHVLSCLSDKSPVGIRYKMPSRMKPYFFFITFKNI